MTKFKILITNLNDLFVEVNFLFEEQFGFSMEGEDTNNLMGEMNGTMDGILKNLGFYIDEDYLYWDSANYGKINFWCELVFECYEGNLSDTNLWDDFFGFGGDDDVDYNGSYIQGLNEFLNFLNDRDLLEIYGIVDFGDIKKDKESK
jgi:hypothetical protein